MKLTASLPMYDFPEVRGTLDTLWNAIARRLEEQGVDGVPPDLVHGRALRELWSDPSLLLSQCCGYDVVNRYPEELIPVATPRYTAPGCQGCDYSSVVLVAESSPAAELEDLRGAVCVINGPESHSGANALRALIAPLSREGRFFSRVRISGTHLDSITALTSGRADVTAIDCVTYALLERHRSTVIMGTRALQHTVHAPGIPYVTRADRGEKLVSILRHALLGAFEEARVQAACADMFIGGIETLPPSTYQRIAEIEHHAIAQGYPELR